VGRELRVHSVPTRTEHLRTVIEMAAICAAGIWAIYTFVFEQRIKPLLERPSFAVPTDVEQGSTIDGVVFVTIHKRLQNTGNVPVAYVAEALSVYGETLERTQSTRRRATAQNAEVYADVPRRTAKLLYSFAKLRSGAAGGSPLSNFLAPPHTSIDESVLVAVPARAFPVILVARRDYIRKLPIDSKLAVSIVRAPDGAYDLRSRDASGEYDSEDEYAIRR
jgi:hypothetical protein